MASFFIFIFMFIFIFIVECSVKLLDFFRFASKRPVTQLKYLRLRLGREGVVTYVLILFTFGLSLNYQKEYSLLKPYHRSSLQIISFSYYI